MASINEAYRVLSDPARRVMYDRSLDTASAAATGSAAGAGTTSAPGDEWDGRERPAAPRHTVLSPAGPARVPWKLMLVLATVGSGAVLVSSFFDDPPSVEAPDGLLRLGSCVAFEPNGDVREVECTGTDDDVVVEIMVPLDSACPAGTEARRDRQGIVMVCIPNE
jgi:molecular chaperone DnaJ